MRLDPPVCLGPDLRSKGTPSNPGSVGWVGVYVYILKGSG